MEHYIHSTRAHPKTMLLIYRPKAQPDEGLSDQGSGKDLRPKSKKPTLLETNMETKKAPIKTTARLKGDYLGFHVSLGECKP